MSMHQYTALIVDDEANNRENLVGLLAKHCPGIEVLAQAASVSEAAVLCEKLQPEVVFLDIEMPGGNGFGLLEKLAPVPFKVIFVTAYDAYALEAIKCSALDYVLKPIDKNELIKAVAKLEPREQQQDRLHNLGEFIQGGEKKMALSLTDEIRLVKLGEIIRIEADNNYCHFHLVNEEEVLVSKHLGHYYDLLKGLGFVRVHQSHLINRNFIERFVKRDGGYLVLSNGDQVPVSRTQREHVIALFSDLR